MIFKYVPTFKHASTSEKSFKATILLIISLVSTLSAMPGSATQLPNFRDPYLQACFDEQMFANGWQTAEEVRQLSCENWHVQDLWGIEQLPLLETLDTSENRISDLYPLSMIQQPAVLHELRLANNTINNIDPLFGYHDLTTLWLSGNPGIDPWRIRDLVDQNPGITRLGIGGIDIWQPDLQYFFTNTAGILELDISQTGIEFLRGIESYPSLQSLDVSGNRIQDLTPLANLPDRKNLQQLRLADNAITDVTPLSGFFNLTTLWLSGNSTIDFQQLRPIVDQNPNLTRLGLGDIAFGQTTLPAFNINPSALTELDVRHTGIQDLAGIEAYTALQTLDASQNGISELNPLAALAASGSLRELWLGENEIRDVAALSSIHNLTTLWLSGNSGIDFQQLHPILSQNPAITKLGLGDIDLMHLKLWDISNDPARITMLDVSNTGITDLAGLESFNSLQSLDASGNQLVDVSPLGWSMNPSRLHELRLANNAINNIDPLLTYYDLTTLWLSGNPGIDPRRIRDLIDQNPGITRLGIGSIDIQQPDIQYLLTNTAGVLELDISQTGIEFLSGIESYPELQSLDASGNRIQDLKPLSILSDMQNLKQLRLADNAITDVTPLSGFFNLTTLWLSGNSTIDFQQLRPIVDQNPNLTRLGLGDIAFGQTTLPAFNINPSALTELDVRHTGIQDLAGIEAYTAMQTLDASQNGISELNPLATLAASGSLRELWLEDNAISDVTPLSGFHNLTTLWLSGNSGIDFQQLHPILSQNPAITKLGIGGIDMMYFTLMDFSTDPARITMLDVSNTGINDLAGLELFDSLQSLDASGNQLVDVSPLGWSMNRSRLHELRLANNAINNIDPLLTYHDLTTLWLSGNPGIDPRRIRDLIDQNPGITRLGIGSIDIQQPDIQYLLTNTAGVLELDISQTGIEFLSGIESYPELQSLDASGNRIQDLKPLFILSDMQNLKQLRLADNAITDVTPLSGFFNLTTLWLSGNSTIDFQQLRPIVDQNPNLTRLGLGDIAFGQTTLPAFNINPSALTELDVRHTGIQDLAGIEAYTTLQTLDASQNGISELNPLATLAASGSLRELWLGENEIRDVAALSSIHNLTTLWLSGNSGIDFQQLHPILSQNPAITKLGLGDIDLMHLNLWDISKDPARITMLDVSNTGITDLAGLGSFNSLQSLDASGNQLVDVSPLGWSMNPSRLHELRLANNAINNIDPLLTYYDLTTLWLSGNPGIDPRRIRDLIDQNPGITRLGIGSIDIQQPDIQYLLTNTAGVLELDISQTGIEFLSGIESYPELQSLDASGNRIQDLKPLSILSDMQNLKQLRLADNAITDVTPLSGFFNLTTLWLSGNSTIDFQQLRPIVDQNPNLTRLGLGDIAFGQTTLPAFNINPSALTELDVRHTGIQDLAGIEAYTTLQTLDASQNGISELNPLATLAASGSLRELWLEDNAISDVTPLSGFHNLTTLWLSGNSGIDFQQLHPILSQNPAITKLGLGDIDLMHLNLWNISKDPARITMLDVSNTGITDLAGLESFNSLQSLDASGNQLVDVSPLGWSMNRSRLHELRLANNAINNIDPLLTYHDLTTLWLSGNPGIDAWRIRDLINQNPGITRLGIGGIDIRQPDLNYFLSDASRIVELDVSQTRIESMRGIASFYSLNRLEASNNPLLDIHDLIGLPNLQYVDLRGTSSLPCDQLDQLEMQLTANSGVLMRPASCVRGNTPFVDIRQPASGASFYENQTINLIANAQDVEDGDLGGTVLWSSDLSGVLGSGAVLEVTLPLGNHSLSATVTDSDFNTVSESVSINVQFNNPPQLTVSAPDEGFTTEQNLPLKLSATAFDQEDGDLSMSINWSSDLVGALGTGNELSVTLEPGTHQISVNVTDTLGKTASITRSVTVF